MSDTPSSTGGIVFTVNEKTGQSRINIHETDIGTCVSCKNERDLRYGYCLDCAPADVHDQVNVDNEGLPPDHPEVQQKLKAIQDSMGDKKIGKTTLGKILGDILL